jgi:hypothetical protein
VTGSRPGSRSETGRPPASVLRVHPQPEDQQGHANRLFVEVPVGMCRPQPSVGSHVAVLLSDPEGYFADE